MFSTSSYTVFLCLSLALSINSVPTTPNRATEDCIPPVCRPKWPQSEIDSLEGPSRGFSMVKGWNPKDVPPTTPSKYAIDYMPSWAARPEKVDAPPEAPRTRTSKNASALGLRLPSPPINSGIAGAALKNEPYNLTTVWLRAEFNEFKKGYAEVRHDSVKRKDFLDKRSEHFAELARIENAYRAWALRKQNELEAELQDIRRGRLKNIKQKLSEAGWASDLETLSYPHREAFLQLPIVKEARPLTDQTWNKIKPEIFSLLEKFRAERLNKERSKNIELRCRMFARQVKKYASTQCPDDILPSAADLYFLPSLASFKARLEEDASEVAYSTSHFDHILTEMPRYCEEWKCLCVAQILDVANNDPSAKEADLPMTYDEGSLHLARTAFRQDPQSCADDRVKMDEAMQHLNSIPWAQLSASGFRLLPPDLTGTVVRACGFDPDLATSDDLDAQRIWLVGDRLAKDGHPTQVMGWKKALHLSCWNKYLGYTDSYTWTRVTDESLIETYNVAELEFYKTTQLTFPVICGRCSQQTPVATLLQHFKAHTDEALKLSDFRVHLDAPPSQLFSLKTKREVAKANSL
ncbi:hypothetical protein ONZ45_g11485 [Pleurotus djamor]|nr:hypothetical protein ONZ45_g11485 [Pleurotus djamor]